MAEKKTAKTAQTAESKPVETIADANVATNNNPEKSEKVMLTETELEVIQIQEQAAAGNQPTGKYKLKDPDTQFSDAESGFTLAEDQEKELPEDPSPELLARIRSGFIVKA
jgi:hypothetical protein